MKLIPYNNPKPGCYVDESSGSADDCNLRTIAFAESYGFKHDRVIEACDEDDRRQALSEIGLSEIADEAVSFLNELETRSYLYWAHEDNSLFLCADVDSAVADVEFVSSKFKDFPDYGFRGEWLHVSDHGNATLYVRGDNGTDTEVWSVA